MIRYTSFAGSIARIVPNEFGYSIIEAKRVPEPVRVLFGAPVCGVREVDWDDKTRTAKVVPYWERIRM